MCAQVLAKGFFGLLPNVTEFFHLPRSPWIGLTAEAIAPLCLIIAPRVGILVLVIVLAHLGAQGPQSITWLFMALSFSFLRQSDLAVIRRYRSTAIALVILAFPLAIVGVLKMSGPFEIGRIFRPGLYIGLVLSTLFIVTGLLITDNLKKLRAGEAIADVASTDSDFNSRRVFDCSRQPCLCEQSTLLPGRFFRVTWRSGGIGLH